MPDEQLLFPWARQDYVPPGQPKPKRRRGDRVRNVALELQEVLHAFGCGWLTRAEWARHCYRGRSEDTAGRAWCRLLASLRRLGVPHETRRELEGRHPKELRLRKGAWEWVEDALPEIEHEEDHMSWEQLERALGVRVPKTPQPKGQK